NIPRPLLDRMELITLSGYTEVKKAQIDKRHLIPKQIKEHGLTSGQLQIREQALLKLMRTYMIEAGVRAVERQIAKLCRKTAKIIVAEERIRVIVTENIMEELL